MKCKVCNIDIKSNRDLLGHLKSAHDTNPISYFEQYPTAEKFCSKCKSSLPITRFLSDKTNNYGYRTQCIECMKPGGINKACPICNRVFKWSAVINHMKHEHGVSPADGFNIHLKEKYCPNCEKVKDLSCFAKLKDPEKVYFSWCNDCNLERNIARGVADQDFDLFQYLVIRLAFSDKCFTCGVTHDDSLEKYNEPLHVDHSHAFSKGGALSLDNVVLLCKACNLKKGTKELFLFLHDLGLSEAAIHAKLSQLADIHYWADIELKRVLKRNVYRIQDPNNGINTDG